MLVDHTRHTFLTVFSCRQKAGPGFQTGQCPGTAPSRHGYHAYHRRRCVARFIRRLAYRARSNRRPAERIARSPYSLSVPSDEWQQKLADERAALGRRVTSFNKTAKNSKRCKRLQNTQVSDAAAHEEIENERSALDATRQELDRTFEQLQLAHEAIERDREDLRAAREQMELDRELIDIESRT